jgi:hypothetical protein
METEGPNSFDDPTFSARFCAQDKFRIGAALASFIAPLKRPGTTNSAIARKTVAYRARLSRGGGGDGDGSAGGAVMAPLKKIA